MPCKKKSHLRLPIFITGLGRLAFGTSEEAVPCRQSLFFRAQYNFLRFTSDGILCILIGFCRME